MLPRGGPKARLVRPIKPPGMKKDQLSISRGRTNALSIHAARTNHAAASPTKDLATPTEKKSAIPSSARANAAALDTETNDKSVVVDRTTRTFRCDFSGGTAAIGLSALYGMTTHS